VIKEEKKEQLILETTPPNVESHQKVKSPLNQSIKEKGPLWKLKKKSPWIVNWKRIQNIQVISKARVETMEYLRVLHLSNHNLHSLKKCLKLEKL